MLRFARQKREMEKLEKILNEINNKTRFGLLSQTARKDRDVRMVARDIGQTLMELTKKSLESLETIKELDEKRDIILERKLSSGFKRRLKQKRNLLKQETQLEQAECNNA